MGPFLKDWIYPKEILHNPIYYCANGFVFSFDPLDKLILSTLSL